MMEDRGNILRSMNICRFCLREDIQLSSIYERQIKEQQANSNRQQNVPLPLQLMACVAIEVFPGDGMPQMICNSCRHQTLQAYTFKSNCKKADDALKVYLATGTLTKPWTDDELTEFDESLIQFSETVISSTPKLPPPLTTTTTTRKSRQECKSLQKRLATTPPKLESNIKRIKENNEEVITLNFTNLTEDVQEDDENDIEEDDDDDDDDDEGVERTEVEDDGLIDEQSQQDDGEVTQRATNDTTEEIEFINFEEESVLNPTLMVNQVQTDCFSCTKCERSFPLKQLLDLHIRNHTRERSYNCEECDKAFFTKYDLSKHLLTHTGCKPFICIVCNKSFARESLLHRHEKVHTDVPKYLCTECDRTFLTREDLDAHAVKHKKKRPFTCKICLKSFVFKQGLERHEMTHSTVKPHKCNYCEASFTSSIKLTRHVTSHAGLRPYPCKICGRTFLLSHHLTRHVRSHYAAQIDPLNATFDQSIGQHKCDICSMSFRRKDSLINHSAIHSMVNLKCVICNTEFDNVTKVKEHITTHLSDLPFPCEKCDYSFETQEQLEDHELKHAEMEYEEQIEQEVIAEARQAAESRDGELESRSDYSGDDMDIAEFTITNDINNPEVVRRSRRPSKIKNYADFLKSELGSDLDENEEMEQQDEISLQEPSEGMVDEVAATSIVPSEDDVIKPIVRSEGTKVYTRKNVPENRPKVIPSINLDAVTTAPLSKITQPPMNTLEQIACTRDISKLPEKEIFNMKIGDKTVTVQKLLLTKQQMKMMAKEGKIEKKGNTFLLKKTPGQNLQTVNLNSLIGTSAFKSFQSKKVYPSKGGNGTETECETFRLPYDD